MRILNATPNSLKHYNKLTLICTYFALRWYEGNYYLA